MTLTPTGFSQWLTKVDGYLLKVAGLTMLDLADYPYSDSYIDGATASETANDVLRENGWMNN